MRLFGFEIRRVEEELSNIDSFTPKQEVDGAVVVAAGGSFGTYIDLDGTIRTEAELVTRYREMAGHPEIIAAVDEIVNDAINMDDEYIINIVLDDLDDLEDGAKQIITQEFEEALRLLDFNNQAYDLFRRWYIDGRLYFHAMIDETAPGFGIQELRYIDPRKIRKIREITKVRGTSQAGVQNGEAIVQKTVNEYYIYNERGFQMGTKNVTSSTPASGIRIARDSVVHVPSGETDANGQMVLSYLHPAIKPLNQLRTLEDAAVIYRLVRAPERRVWYIDIGNLPTAKAEQYLRDQMLKHKNRLVYDAQSGDVRDDRKFMTMLEDYWLPRRENGKGTEVTTLDGGQNLGEMDDVLYFQKRLYRSLNVPVERIDSESVFNFGQTGQITREEVKFSKFIGRLRNKFCAVFLSIMEKNVVLKNIMSIEDWQALAPRIKFDFAKDNYFAELTNSSILMQRMNLLQMMEMYVGRYYSNEWVRKNVLKQTDDDMTEIDEQIMMEMFDPQYQQPMQPDPMMQQDPMGPEGSAETQGVVDSYGSGETQNGNDYVQALKQYQELKAVKKRTPNQIHNLRSVAQILAKGNMG